MKPTKKVEGKEAVRNLANQMAEMAICYKNPPFSWTLENNGDWLVNRSLKIATQTIEQIRQEERAKANRKINKLKKIIRELVMKYDPQGYALIQLEKHYKSLKQKK